MYLKEKIPFSHAIFWIVSSVIFITGGLSVFFFYSKIIQTQYLKNSSYNIIAIIQTCSCHEGLKTAYLAELLELSHDKPTNLYAFDLKKATSKLISHPVIKFAEIKKVLPGTIHIDYSLRQPIGTVLDFSNTAFDEEGVFFPFHPFYTPKKIPEVFFGMEINNNSPWINNRENPIVQKTLHLLKELIILSDNNYRISRIDLSKAQADSYGKREIVVILEEEIKLHQNEKVILRLHPENFKEGIKNYSQLQKRCEEKFHYSSISVDLRLPGLAFISEFNP